MQAQVAGRTGSFFAEADPQRPTLENRLDKPLAEPHRQQIEKGGLNFVA
jgi:hypothetical protein